VGSIYFLILANKLFEVKWKLFLHKLLPPVVMMLALGFPAKMLCNYLWIFAEYSRWLKLGVLVFSGISYVVAGLLALNLLQRLFFSSDERQKISSLPIPGLLNGVWKKLWRTA
jgi:hypothetical protein